MKKVFSVIGSLMLLAFIVSCSSKPDDLPVSQDGSVTKSVSIIAAAGNITTTDIVFTKEDFKLGNNAKWVEQGLVQTSSKITFEDIVAGGNFEITNVQLSLGSNSKNRLNLPVVTQNTTFNELSQLNFLQQVLNEVVKRGSSRVVFSYKTAGNITNPAKMNIKIDGKFNY